MKALKLHTLLSLVVCGAATAIADTTNQAVMPRPGQFGAQDYRLLVKAVHGDEMEFIFGGIGDEKTSDGSVKTFAHHILEDRQKTHEALAQLIKEKGATLPGAGSVADGRLLAQLNGLGGAAFDRTYMDTMVQEYQSAIQDLEYISANTNDSDLKHWVTQTLPIWQEHLRLAQNTDATVRNGDAVGENQ
jgi:putative membrane protein